MNASPPVPTKHRWLGVLLSLLVPGFGILRAGHPRRALAWFLGIHLGALVLGISVSLSVVPFSLAVIIFGAVIIAQIWMLLDSFRPGRMTLPLWLLLVGLLVSMALLPTPASLVQRAFKVPTGAMEPTLMGSRSASGPDYVIVDRLSYRFSAPKRGDLIVFAGSQISGIPRPESDSEDEVFYIKRLVGLPGERIRISAGKLFADGRPLGEADNIPSSIRYTEPVNFPSSAKREGGDFVIGTNEYFALGDNSSNSLDSRYWGCVPSSAVYGKVTMIYYPFSRVGRVTKPTTALQRTSAERFNSMHHWFYSIISSDGRARPAPAAELERYDAERNL